MGPVERFRGILEHMEMTPSVDGHFDRISTQIDEVFGTKVEFRRVCQRIGPVDGELGNYYGDLSRYYGQLDERITFVSISNSQRAGAPDLPWAATVYNGVRVSDHDFRRDKDDFVLFIGRCCPEKAPELAVHAAAKLAAS